MYRTDPRTVLADCPDGRFGFTALAATYEKDGKYTEAALARERAAIGFDADQILKALLDMDAHDIPRLAGWLRSVAEQSPVKIHTEGIDTSDCVPMELNSGRWDEIHSRCSLLVARIRLLQRVERGVADEERAHG